MAPGTTNEEESRMIPAIYEGKIIFYWQTDKNIPMAGDQITYDGHVYEVLFRHFTGKDIQLIIIHVSSAT
jgi:hypothetical protein